MLKLNHITGSKENSKVREFNFCVHPNCISVILSPSVNFLDELQTILCGTEKITSGEIILNDCNFYDKKKKHRVAAILNEGNLFEARTVAENIFTEKSFISIGNPKNGKVFQQLLNETGFSLEYRDKVEGLTSERKKIVEILRAFYQEPELLIIREPANQLSYNSFAIFLKVLEKMKRKGTVILCLTSQWEESIKLADEITVVVHDRIQKTYQAEEVKKDPSILGHLLMGAQDYMTSSEWEKKEIDSLRTLSINIQKNASGHDIKNVLQAYSQYLIGELSALSGRAYFISRKQNKIVDMVGVNDINGNYAPHLKKRTIHMILEQEDFFCMDHSDLTFYDNFEEKTIVSAMLAYPIKISTDISVLFQFNFKEPYSLSKRQRLLIEWVAQELAIILENSQLMGHSVLLRESYHRIKNSLQIVISLLEMEKESIGQKVTEFSAIETMSQSYESTIGRIKSIAQIQDLLTKSNFLNNLMDMYSIVNAVCSFYKDNAKITLKFSDILIPYSKAVSIALVINEIISNSVKHNYDMKNELMIDIAARKDQNQIQLTCKDNGIGFSVKKKDTEMSEGVGMSVIQSIICFELNGAVDFRNDNGALVTIDIPLESLLPLDIQEHEKG